MNTEPWWCCSCGAKIYRVGKRHDPDYRVWKAHILVCPITEKQKKQPDKYICQGMHIKQCPQGKK